MRKRLFVAFLAMATVFSLGSQAPPQTQMKLEDVQKALSLVEKAQAAPDKYKAGLDVITAKDSLAILSYLSSDWMEGRETGTRGYQMAAEYVASLFKLWGIKPAGDMPRGSGRMPGMGGGTGQPAPAPERSYFQEFALREISDIQTALTVDVRKGDTVKTRKFQAGVDFANMGSGSESLSAPVVFAGFGLQESSIGWDEFKNLNIKGKIVLILSEAPGKDNPQSPFQQKKELKDKYFPAAPTGPPTPGGAPRFNKTTEIAKLGPAAIFQVQNTGKDVDVFRNLSTVRRPSDDRPIINRPRRRLSIPGLAPATSEPTAPVVNITREMANLILETAGQTIDDLKKKIETTNKPASMDLGGVKVSIDSTAKASLSRGMNIVGMIEGSDPKLKDEVFVVGAHFDHLGKWEDYVYNGADDNASGSVGVMNIARAMMANPVKPKRTVVFCLWTGEEQGLLGSRYYVNNPPYPIAKTVGCLNYDMISRAYDEQTIARPSRQLNVAGAEELVKKIRPAWFVTVQMTAGAGYADIEREMNKYVGLDLFMREAEAGRGGGGSDHASFAAVKVPFVYYMAAMTSDYHQTSDSIEKVSGELMAKISQLGYLTVFAFADK